MNKDQIETIVRASKIMTEIGSLKGIKHKITMAKTKTKKAELTNVTLR